MQFSSQFIQKNRWLWIACGLLTGLGVLFLPACRGLDDDTNYAPETIAAFFLSPHPVDSTLQTLTRFTDDTFLPDWQNQFRLTPETLTDLAGKENTLWISSANQREILEIDLREERLVNTRSTQGARPDLLVPGSDYLLFSDVPARRLGFMDYNNQEIFFLEIDFAARSLLYNSGKFYVVGDTQVTIFRESALAPISTQFTDTPIAHSFFDNQGDLFLFACEGNDCKQYVIDANGDIFTANSPSNRNDQLISLSPFLRQQYGREYLGDLRLRNSTLEPVGIDSVNWFSMDFFEGDLYFSRGNQPEITRQNLHNNELTLWPGNGLTHATKSYFYIDNQAD